MLALAVTANGAPARHTGLAAELSAASGLDLHAIVTAQVIGVSTVLFPYPVPPVLMASELGGMRPRDGTRLALA